MSEVITMADTEYLHFQMYMKERRGRYHPALFSQDIMYFCKIWKSHRQMFAEYCKRHDCVRSYIFLNQRCVEYESSLLDRKLQLSQISELEYQRQQRLIEKVYL